jgi:hypothetical protein
MKIMKMTVFIFAVYFVIDSVLKLLDRPSYDLSLLLRLTALHVCTCLLFGIHTMYLLWIDNFRYT